MQKEDRHPVIKKEPDENGIADFVAINIVTPKNDEKNLKIKDFDKKLNSIDKRTLSNGKSIDFKKEINSMFEKYKK